MFLVIGGLSMMSHHYTLGNIKSRTVGDRRSRESGRKIGRAHV